MAEPWPPHPPTTGAKTSFMHVFSLRLGEALARDKSAFPEEFAQVGGRVQNHRVRAELESTSCWLPLAVGTQAGLVVLGTSAHPDLLPSAPACRACFARTTRHAATPAPAPGCGPTRWTTCCECCGAAVVGPRGAWHTTVLRCSGALARAAWDVPSALCWLPPPCPLLLHVHPLLRAATLCRWAS